MTQEQRDSVRNRALEMRLEGKTYAEIGSILGVSRQRVQQIVRPSPDIYAFIKKQAEGKCQHCGIEVADGHVHHKSTKLNDVENYDDIENLIYLCPSCHRVAHKGDREPKIKDPVWMTLVMPPRLKRKLVVLAEKKKLSLSELIRRLISENLLETK